MTSEDKAKALSNPIRDEGERSLLGEVKAAQQKLAVGTLKVRRLRFRCHPLYRRTFRGARE